MSHLPERYVLPWRSTLAFIAAIGILMAGPRPFVWVDHEVVHREAPTPAFAGVGASFEVLENPERLFIPKINVDAVVQKTGLTKNGDMGIPTNFTDVAWYKHGPRPGEPGSAVIDGHLDGRNVKRAVFYDLEKLVPGDIVQVKTEDGKIIGFHVTKVKIFAHDEPADEIFNSNDGKAHLNLITCAGDWIREKKIYEDRIVVFTERDI